MAPTVEIDDEVYGWLKQHAEPFVDSPNTVIRRAIGIDGDAPPAVAPQIPVGPVAPPSLSGGSVVVLAASGRPKLNARALKGLGVSHFEVVGTIPSWEGKQAHPRAYLDAVLDKGIASFKYYERHSPHGDAASRVILKIGSSDYDTVVCFHSGRRVPMAEFVQAFLAGTL